MERRAESRRVRELSISFVSDTPAMIRWLNIVRGRCKMVARVSCTDWNFAFGRQDGEWAVDKRVYHLYNSILLDWRYMEFKVTI